MKRRTLLAAAAAAPLALPLRAGAQRSRVVKFIPLGDLAVRDPIRVPVKVTLHHAYMVFDTLYGMDAGSRSTRRWWRATPPARTVFCGS